MSNKYREGYEAGFDGLAIDNPYPQGTVGFKDWAEGFLDGNYDHNYTKRPHYKATEGHDMNAYQFAQGSKSKSEFGFYNAPKCAHSHPPLALPGGYVIQGGAASSPIVKDADVYISFESHYTPSARSWPWKKGEDFIFPITDMAAPNDAAEFKKLIDWVIVQLQAGKKVHCGCIGGHGRTGTFLAALVKTMDPNMADPIQYVRSNYCKKAVESSEQVQFLVKHFECQPVEGYKSKSSNFTSFEHKSYPSSKSSKSSAKSNVDYQPLSASKKSIW